MNDMTPMNPDAYVEFGEDAFAVGGSVIGVFLIVYFMILFLALAFSAVTYVLHSLGLYTIANRRGIRHGWLAWIPLGNVWILGSISDQYQYVAKGKVRNRRKIMLGLGIGVFAVYFWCIIAVIISTITGDMVTMGASILLLLAVMIVAIALTVLEYMAYYDLYHSCQPNESVLYLVLSILFSVTMPFFVFICRKKDLGMPPRKQEAVQQIVQPEQPAEVSAAEPVEEPVAEPVEEPAPEPEEGYAQPEEFEEE